MKIRDLVTRMDNTSLRFSSDQSNATTPPWWRCWEFYPIILIASLLRLYKINITQFNDDQIQIFMMARYAVVHHWLFSISNHASVGIYNPPGIVYCLMIPAAFSANPLSGALFTAALAIFAVILTYIFAYRYYGRWVAIVASLFYAVACWPVFYSRFMWNQNMLHLPLVIFLYLLFRGAVDHRRGWFFPAVCLLAFIVQLHESSIELVAPLVFALFLAPRSTVRWYEPFLCIVGVALLYSTYIFWLFNTSFMDIIQLLHDSQSHGLSLLQPLTFYLNLLAPAGKPYLNIHSILYSYRVNISNVLLWILSAFLLLGLLYILWKVLVTPGRQDPNGMQESEPAKQHAKYNTAFFRLFTRLSSWWKAFRSDPLRCGLCILLVWQVIPLVSMFRSSIQLHQHYFIVFMPAIFIILALGLRFFMTLLLRGLKRYRNAVHWGYTGFVVVLLAATCFSTICYIIDSTSGHFVDTQWDHPYEDLASMQSALKDADQFSVQNGYRVIIVQDGSLTIDGMAYLSQSLHTPTVIANNNCLVLPPATLGSAVLLAGPHSTAPASLATRFANAKLVRTLPHPGGPDYRLYVLPPSTPPQPLPAASTVKFSGPSVQALATVSAPGVVATRYLLPGQGTPAFHQEYHFVFKRYSGPVAAGKPHQRMIASSDCLLLNYLPGMQLLAPLGSGSLTPRIYVQATTFDRHPRTPIRVSLLGRAFQLQSYAIVATRSVPLNVIQDTNSYIPRAVPTV